MIHDRSAEEHRVILDVLANALVEAAKRSIECQDRRGDGTVCRECVQHADRIVRVTDEYLVESGMARRRFWTQQRVLSLACMALGAALHVAGISGLAFYVTSAVAALALAFAGSFLPLPEGAGFLGLGRAEGTKAVAFVGERGER